MSYSNDDPSFFASSFPPHAKKIATTRRPTRKQQLQPTTVPSPAAGTGIRRSITIADSDAIHREDARGLKRLHREALESDYAFKQVAYLCNNIGPRLTGSSQAQRAVEYVADEMKRLGLTGKAQGLKVPHWVRGLETGALLRYPGMAPGTSQKIVLTALGGSVATPPTGLNAEVVVVDNFDELSALPRRK